MAVLAYTDLQWCLLTWQHILTPCSSSSTPTIHPEATHTHPGDQPRDSGVSAGGHLAPLGIWARWLHPCLPGTLRGARGLSERTAEMQELEAEGRQTQA